jgi:hypothetical protein
MKWDRLSVVLLGVMFGTWQSASAAMVNPSLAKAKSEAEAKVDIFLTSHDEIIAEAKKEKKLRVVSGLSPESLKTIRKTSSAFVEQRAGLFHPVRFRRRALSYGGEVCGAAYPAGH